MILQEIADATRQRVEKAKLKTSLDEMKQAAVSSSRECVDFNEALVGPDIAFICEVKKASPSKGIITEDFFPQQIAQEYEQAGAAAISVLTEPDYFQGNNDYLEQVKEKVSVPVLRKDFTVDLYQIYEAKVIGADAVLLICALLDTRMIAEFIAVAESLGLATLVEAHDEAEIESALAAGARIVGVNNRDLKTFEVDITRCAKLRRLVPSNVVFVAESGIKTSDDIQTLRRANVDAVLIGETLMKSPDKKAMLEELREYESRESRGVS